MAKTGILAGALFLGLIHSAWGAKSTCPDLRSKVSQNRSVAERFAEYHEPVRMYALELSFDRSKQLVETARSLNFFEDVRKRKDLKRDMNVVEVNKEVYRIGDKTFNEYNASLELEIFDPKQRLGWDEAQQQFSFSYRSINEYDVKDRGGKFKYYEYEKGIATGSVYDRGGEWGWRSRDSKDSFPRKLYNFHKFINPKKQSVSKWLDVEKDMDKKATLQGHRHLKEIPWVDSAREIESNVRRTVKTPGELYVGRENNTLVIEEVPEFANIEHSGRVEIDAKALKSGIFTGRVRNRDGGKWYNFSYNPKTRESKVDRGLDMVKAYRLFYRALNGTST